MALIMPFQLEVWIVFAITTLAVMGFIALYTLIDPDAIFRTKDVWLYTMYMIFDESYAKFLVVRYI